MFQKLRCYHCNDQGLLYMKLDDFSRFYCLRCDGHWDADDVADGIVGSRKLGEDETCDLDEITEQTEAWQKVLDFVNVGA